MKREDLTPGQREVMDARERVVLVLGGAGAGKTTVALWSGRAAIKRGEVGPWQRVLFLTFSRTAVTQLASRARGVVKGAGEAIEVSTFHSFGLRLLRAFGRYGGRGTRLPEVQSEARAKLLGRDATLLAYDDLVPGACELLDSERIRNLVARRWPVVICDEFQDTSPDQWRLVRRLGERARLLLLADPHQMIYTFVPGVGPERLEEAKAMADRIIDLEPASHRDPTGCIPAMADAVRRRAFSEEPIRHAVATDRLRVYGAVADEELPKIIRDEVEESRLDGHRSVGIFGHSNEGVAVLSAALSDEGVAHALVGIPESQGEALACLATLCGFALGSWSWEDSRVALATFLTACTRGNQPPPLATGLAFGRPPVPQEVERRLQSLEARLRAAAGEGSDQIVAAALGAWDALGLTVGTRPWRRAALSFAAVARRLSSSWAVGEDEAIRRLAEEADRMRIAALVGGDDAHLGPVQLMNFHQTKGREADVVLLVYRSGDYLAHRTEAEPYDRASRVLYVSLTRARHRATVILPEEPHPLVRPFAAWISHAR